jgi:anthranilate phosphoribosyltransferase
MTSAAFFAETLADLLERRDLDSERTIGVMRGVLLGALGEAEVAALLVALRMKGETADELAAAATVVRELMVPLETGREGVLDTCGTGGDGCRTFNISTATALVAAAAGVPVVKHGNRAVSSRTGSADVLEALGVEVHDDVAACRRALDRSGMAFCLAPNFHPAMRHVGAVRQRLGVRTIFNAVGPLANPARAPYQLLGVGQPEWLDRMAQALAQLEIRRAFLVCGRDGLDEVTLTAATMVREVQRQVVSAHEWTAADFGLEPCSLDDLRVTSPEESAAVIRSVLTGKEGPALRVVLANAAAALLAAERVGSLTEGVGLARQAVRTGRAARVLERLACRET